MRRSRRRASDRDLPTYNLDAFYKEHPHLGRKPKGSAWLTLTSSPRRASSSARDANGGFFLEELDDDAAAAWAPIGAPASDGAAAILALVARADARSAFAPLAALADARGGHPGPGHALQKAVSFRRAPSASSGVMRTACGSSDTADLDFVARPAFREASSWIGRCTRMARELDADGEFLERARASRRRGGARRSRWRRRSARPKWSSRCGRSSSEKVQKHEDKWRSVCEEIPKLEGWYGNSRLGGTRLSPMEQVRVTAVDKTAQNRSVYPTEKCA